MLTSVCPYVCTADDLGTMSYTNLFGRRRSTRVAGRYGPTEYGRKMCFALNIGTDDSRVVSVTAHAPTLWIRGEHESLDTSEVAFVGEEMALYSEWLDVYNRLAGTTTKRFRSESGAFTVKELMECIVEFEKEDRPKTLWGGGVDCHHIFYDGLRHTEGKGYQILWGS